ncbi:MAG: ORF6N domain-containing protein [Solibacillus sp.]
MYEVIEREGQRVLTTAQVAEAYATDPKSLQRNFQRNKERFEEGVHFLALTGDILKAFKAERQNDASLKFTSLLYLWTEEGAFLLAKSVGSDKGWAAYRLLVTNYYKASVALRQQEEAPLALPFDQKRFLALETRVQEIEQQLLHVTLHSGQQLRLQRAVGERVYSMTVKQAERNKLFRAIYHDLKAHYKVGSYRDIKQHELQSALSFVSSWTNSVYA